MEILDYISQFPNRTDVLIVYTYMNVIKEFWVTHLWYSLDIRIYVYHSFITI
jgi:hypothetical protein